jgi:hypothetical protein
MPSLRPPRDKNRGRHDSSDRASDQIRMIPNDTKPRRQGMEKVKAN